MTIIDPQSFSVPVVKHCRKCRAPLPVDRKHTWCTSCLRDYRVAWNGRRALRLYRWTVERGLARIHKSEAA